MPDPALEIIDLHSWYGESHILQGVTLTIPTGSIVALLGRNGAGKSTLLKATIGIVRERQGVYRYPEPKILAGSNYAEVGFDYDPERGRIVAIAAIDNLMKGAAGTAVQCMNIMYGFDETLGLGFPGLHPV